MAAVLACGPGAVLSHTSAARLWRLLRQPRAEADPGRHPAVHVTVPSEAGREHRDGIRVHRSRTLLPSEVTRRDGIPVTTPTRTLTDLRRILPQPQVAAARRQAEYLGLHIDAGLEPDRTHSELEARLLALCRRHRLPRPQVNVRVGPFLVDFLWSEQRLIVEVDGYRHHGSRNAFESDRARDLELKLRGFEVIRFTWRRLTAEPAQTVAALRRLLWERPHPAD